MAVFSRNLELLNSIFSSALGDQELAVFAKEFRKFFKNRKKKNFKYKEEDLKDLHLRSCA